METARLLDHFHGSDDGEDDGGLECRICRCGAQPDSPLFHPCLCSGSIKYVHQQCLLDWLAHAGSTHCEVRPHGAKARGFWADQRHWLLVALGAALAEPPVAARPAEQSNAAASQPHGASRRPLRLPCRQVCKHRFSFTPVYAKDAPSRLPVHELLVGVVKRAARGVRLAHRVSLGAAAQLRLGRCACTL